MAETVNNTVVVRATHSDGTTDNEVYTMNRAGIVYDMIVIATNAGAGTVTLQNGATAISAGLNPSTTDARAIRSATGGAWVTGAGASQLVVGNTLTFVVSATTLNYEAYAYIYPTPGFPA
jgi:hypothetical protein